MTTYYARNDVLYSGGDKLFSITFSYIKKEHIKVFVNDEETENFTFNNDSQILVSNELINGDVVSIRRTTPIDERMVVFSDTSILNRDNQNLAQTQMFDAVQEMKDDNTAFQININEDFSDYQDEIEGAFETYKNTIDNEIETIDGKADSAISTANSAETKANTAVSTANTANGKADNAVTTANSASTTANTALSTANSATTTANGAVLTANTASSTATAASNKVDALEEDITDVLEAAEKINELEEAVTTATTAATNAATAATNASTAAQTATTKAQEATNAAATFKQSDWNQTDTDAKDYIKNKPTIQTVDQTYDSTSAHAQSGVAINGAKFIRNLANSSNFSLTIIGKANTNKYNCINIGATSEVTGYNSIAIGVGANSAAGGVSLGTLSDAGQDGVAIGYQAIATNDAIQIGEGTNNTSNSLQIGSYQLLNTSTGLIPDARISNNIVKSVNNVVPDANGNVTIQGGGGGSLAGLPNYSSSNITTFQKTTWFTAPSNGWVHYAHHTPSSTHRQFQIKDPQGNIVFYGIVGKTLNTGAFHTIFVFLPQGYSYYAETADIATYDSTTEQYSLTQGAFFIPAYT